MLSVISFGFLLFLGEASIKWPKPRLEGTENSSSLMQMRVRTSAYPNSQSNEHQVEHFWSHKNANARRSASAAFTATSELAQPTWILEEAKGLSTIPASNTVYQSPVIDKDFNVYVSSNSGKIRSLRLHDGSERWNFQLGGIPGSQVPTPVLLGNSLLTADSDGNLIALSLSDGHELWRAHYADGDTGFDSWSLASAGSDVVLLLGTVTSDNSTARLYAASTIDGHVLWSFRCAAAVFNFMPAVVGDAVLFSDSSGGVYSLGLSDGKLRWQLPGHAGLAVTTGGLAVGFNNVAYATSNVASSSCTPTVDLSGCGDGLLRAIDLQNGNVLWNRTFAGLPANNAPAISFSPFARKFIVVIGLGRNPLLPCIGCNEFTDEKPPRPTSDVVVALDGLTGSDLWTFKTPIWNSDAPAGSTMQKLCWPDAFSNPSIDNNGTVYIGWKGGVLFALDGGSGTKLSEIDVGSAFGGSPGLAPGIVVAASCNKLVVFVNRQQPL